MGNAASDLFYPDNPSRRARAEELKSDINNIINEFEEQRKLRQDVLARIKPKLDALMKARGFSTADELEGHVLQILKGPELASYKELSARLKRDDEAEGMVWQVIGLMSVSAGALIGGAFVGGIVTGGSALLLVGAVGEILAVLSTVLVLLAVIEGAQERSNLQSAINQLFPKRIEVKLALEQIRLVALWANTIEVWVNNPVTSDPVFLNKLLSATLDINYYAWTHTRVFNLLHDWDHSRSSWTNEDPGFNPAESNFTDNRRRAHPAMLRISAAAVMPTLPRTERAATVTLQVTNPRPGQPAALTVAYTDLVDPKHFIAKDEKIDTWKLRVTKMNEKSPALANMWFSLQKVGSVQKFSMVRLAVVGRTTR